jgi:hypothetical protein
MAPPNPYFIYIELFKADGVTRPNQNEIARVRAYDVNSGVTVWEGESGFNPSTGGWYPVYMQNFAAFYPPREQPNLKFVVYNTQEQIVHTTQIFNAIPSASTVKIVIGVSDALVGGGNNTIWTVSGTVKHLDNTPLTSGTVRAYDITNGSTKELGHTSIGAAGGYSISYTTADFTNNGGSHTPPNLTVRAFDAADTQLGQTGPVAAATNQVLDISVPNVVPDPGSNKRRVFGRVQNQLGLPVSGVIVQAFHVGWTVQNLQEFPLQPEPPPYITSNGAGDYEILYDPPSVSGSAPCSPPAGQVNLIVYAKELEGSTLKVLFTSDVVFDAPAEQRVDLFVNKTAVSTDSEYSRIDTALTPCLGDGTSEAAKWTAINLLNQRPQYLAFVSQATGFDERLLQAYVSAWLIAGEINSKVPGTLLSKPMAPEVIFGLLRVLELSKLPELLNVKPEQFFDSLVLAIHRSIIGAAREAELPTLLADWVIVLQKLMSQSGTGFQSDLLNLVFPDGTQFAQISAPAATPFASAVSAHPVAMPSGVQAGDLLIVLLAHGGASGVTANAPSTEWVQLFTGVGGTSTAVRLTAWAKKATGTEGASQTFTTVTGATATATLAAAHAYRVSKDTWKGDITAGVSIVGASTSGTTGAINPIGLTPSGWGSVAGKTLWLACGGHVGTGAISTAPNSTPANYATPVARTPSGGTTGSCTVLSTTRANAALTEDPGSFVLATAATWAAGTIAIREGLLSASPKREAIINAYFNYQGAFASLVASLVPSVLTAGEAENLLFAFELYEKVGRYFPIVKAVYLKKGTQWHTIQDLAKVPINDGTAQCWYQYALDSLSWSQGTFPADVPGNTSSEKAMVYGTRLFELFQIAGAQQGFAADVAAAAGSDTQLTHIATFLANTPAFDLDRTNVDQYFKAHPGGLTSDEIARLKQLQRVYRLTSDYDAASKLINATPPLDSAVKIARIDEGEFIATWEKDVGGLTAARDIHRTASRYASEVMFTLVKFHQNLNDVGGLSAVPGAMSLSELTTALDPTEPVLSEGDIVQTGDPDSRKFPNWVTLFGNLNQCACMQCQTALSPGAYLVDLLEFVDGAPKKTLFERRPDLEDVELTCTNTNTVLPYIDLVNEALEAVVAPLAADFTVTGGVVAILDAAAGDDPAVVLPAMTTLRAEMASRGYTLAEKARVKIGAANTSATREWAIEDDAWRFSIRQTGASAFKLYPSPQTSANNDSLEVFPEHVNAAAYTKLDSAIFPFNLPLNLGREETQIFLKAKNVPHHQVLEAFNVLNRDQELQEPSIGLSYLELGASEASAILGQVSPIRTLWGFDSDTPKIPRPDKPTLRIQGNWIDLMSMVPVFQHRSGLRYQELLELLDTEFVHRFAALATDGAAHGLHLTAPSEALIECQSPEFVIAHLTEQVLQRISFFVRLWRKLGWTMRELDRYLVELEANGIPEVDSVSGTLASRLLRLTHVRRLMDELRLAPRVAVAFYKAMDRRRTERNPRSLFDEVYLVGSPVQLEIQALEGIARGGTISNLGSRPPQEDLRGHVRSALRLKEEDIELLWQRFVLSTSPTTLDIAKLSSMYRYAVLASALKLSITELFDLEDLTGGAVLPTGVVADANLRSALLATHASLEKLRVARLTRMSAAQMTYYLTAAHEADDPFSVTDDGLAKATRRLASAAAEIASANPAQSSPDAAVLGTALAKVMPADKAARALELIQSADPTNGDQRDFVTRYFSVFSSVAPATLLGQLKARVDAGDAMGANKIVWDLLYGHLIDQARTTTAIAVAAELTGATEDDTNTLLTKALKRVSVSSASAIEDWKLALVGGWNTGEATLENANPGERRGTLIASKNGQHRFVARVVPSAGATVTIKMEVDGKVLQLNHAAPTPDGDFVFDPVPLRAGGAYKTTLTFAGAGSKLTLSVRVENDDAVVVPSTAVIAFDELVYTKLYKAVGLVKGLELKKDELRRVVEVPSVLDLNALPLRTTDTHVPWSALQSLLELLELNRTLPLKTGTLFDFWRDVVPTFTSAAEALAATAVQTGWREDDLTVLRGEDPGGLPGLWASGTAPGWDNPALWLVLKPSFRVIRRLDLKARQILPLLVQNPPSVGSAVLLRGIFRGQFSRDTWKEIMKPLRDPLRQRQRDALIGYLTTREVDLPGGAKGNFIDANDLFAHFMIDVEMEADTLISRIKLALNVVQLFVYRVFLGLEDAEALGELAPKKDQWAWMEKFRVWEANRKVFLYPENWIEPDLRDDKSEFFTELEDELVQAPLTHETAMQALSSYLEKMSEVSNLEVIGTFAEGAPADGTNFTLHVIGRTRSRSRGLFYRTFQGKQDYDGYWTPWKRINLEIDADVIMPAVVNGQLHLFWPKITTKERPREQDVRSKGDGGEGPAEGNNTSSFSSSERVQYMAEIRLMWSEYNAKKNKWGKPKLSKSRGVDPNAPTPFQREIGDDQPRTENYHLRVHLESMHVAVDLYKTNVPTEPRTIVYDVREVQFLFWKLLLPAARVIDTAQLDPKLLGTFRIWETGDDGFDGSGSSARFGQNYPIGTVLKSNAAVEVDFSVDNRVAADTLQLGNNAAFLSKTPDFFRIHETNFNFIEGADKQPFFYETNLKSMFALNQPDVAVPALSLQASQAVRFSTFNHPLVEVFQKELRYHGLEGLMHRLVQALPVADDRYYSSYYYDYYYGSLYLGYHIAGDYRALYTTQRIFESEHEPSAATVRSLYPLPTVEFGYGTSFGIYNWELFFHVPMLIAGRLSQDLKFGDAMRWYHSVFDPKQELNKYELTRSWVPTLPPGCRYWNFLPFFSNRKAEDSLLDTLGLTTNLSEYDRNQLTALIAEWRNSPFNPHLIARARIAAYQKFTVMKYLDNLIDWADSLFRQDTFETINEATQLYILADELLGQRPEVVDPLVAEPRLTYRELRAKGIDEFSNAIVEVESLIVSNQPYLKDTVQPPLGSSMTTLKSLALKSFYFKIPRNERLDRYWGVVQDRLFKIRNSMNIDGVKRRLALFEPPIDPALLVRAAAAGLDIGSVLAALNAPLPCYRFNVWIQKATELTNEVKSFGAALLSALEKKDGEALALLRQGHELKMLALVSKVREQQIKEAEENITALTLSRALAEERRDFYRTRVKINQGEQQQIGLTIASTALEAGQGALHGVAGLFGGVPDSIFGMVGPFPAGLVQVKIGSAGSNIATAAANVLGVAASVTRGLGTVAGLKAGHDRRWDDWKLQERLANKEIEQLNQQIVVAEIRLDIAQKELANHEQQIEHAEEVQTFLEDKFTSRELYTWMVSELSRTYNQVYKLAYDAARTAERTFEFELGTTGAGFIQFGYVDSLRQGLLAGEKLMLDIKRMDTAYLEQHKRELEIQKPISLAGFDAQALQDLRETGVCTFELPEVLFDLDFPGHYFRRIKGVRLTIPCVTGPHTSVAAKLSLLGSAYRKESTVVDAPSYPYIGNEDARFVHDPIGITSIATGRAQGDSGLFEFNFRDERYLPFEGAGAISRWRLELPTAFRQFDYNTISDAVLEVSYTARDAGGLLKDGAEKSIPAALNSIRELATTEAATETGLVRVFSLKREFPDAFHRLLTENEGMAAITPEHFPFVIRQANLAMTVVPGASIGVHVVPKVGATLPAAKLKLNGNAEATLSVTNGIGIADLPKADTTLLPGWAPEAWTLAQDGLLTTAVTDDVVLIVQYTVAA